MSDKIYQVIVCKQKKRKFEIVIKDEANKEEQFVISDDLLIEFRLVKDKILTLENYKKFKNAANRDQIFQKVLYYATYKQRSIKEVKTYLDKKQILEIDQDYYLDKLKKVSILNDDSYAKTYIFEAFNYKLLGPRRIIQDLKLKGIRKEIYEKYVSDISHDDIMKNIETLFFKKLKDFKNCSANKAVLSIKRFIVTKGYDFIDIDKIIKANFAEIVTNVNEPAALKKDYNIILKQYDKKQIKQDKYQYILTKLIQKGYKYPDIKALIERS